MSGLTVINPGPRLPANLATELRALADKIESGQVSEFIAAFVDEGHYGMLFGSSLSDSLVLSSLLQARCVERFQL